MPTSSRTVANLVAPRFLLDRRHAVPALIARHEDFLFVAGLAGTSGDITALTDDGAHVYSMAGAMGGAAMMGLGLALARRDRRVMELTGDGESTTATMARPVIKKATPALVSTSRRSPRAQVSSAPRPSKRRQSSLAAPACYARAMPRSLVLLRVKPTEPPKFKRDLDPARCRVRFRMALRPPA
jgi:hypothetical protein